MARSTQETALLSHALPLSLTAAGSTVAAGSSDAATFQGPSINEFFPDPIFFAGTPIEIDRLVIIRFIAVAVLLVFAFAGTRALKLVPNRGQAMIEYGFDVVRRNAFDNLGEREGRRYLPLLASIFFGVLFMNLSGLIPGLNLQGTSRIAMPALLAVIAYIAFIYAGLRKHAGTFLRNALFPPGVPWYLYIIVTPIEFVSTFVLRPITLTLRLLMNMVVGHLLLVLFFSATWFFFTESHGLFKVFGIGTLAFGIAFSFFEILVALLQAYVFMLLTAVYIQLALADEH
ncbi:F0F1 ATP synthase subunit A [Curtobacterium sp. MCBD17_003]|uniref:F0F1 ATP synthase subunit A n=1 Tax=Curtobacterium sp. MCBD17_003 TaxID=2175667 RepID=UPI000DAABF15|nr:F0F1 ATP synthase subunit A [Curtobacterium sp. MCBD17_003]WIE56188.1 F0F1 ATP synthase subunit A [Curtobacterium sp. MCBD17_003]